MRSRFHGRKKQVGLAGPRMRGGLLNSPGAHNPVFTRAAGKSMGNDLQGVVWHIKKVPVSWAINLHLRSSCLVVTIHATAITQEDGEARAPTMR